MKIQFRADLHRVISAQWLFLVVLIVLGAASPAVAQWTATDAQAAFSDYNNAFYFNASGNNYDYRSQQGSTRTSGFWVGAEEIELATDAYTQNPTPANLNVINQLCNGFVAQFGSDWSGDSYDDDLMWATIAFVRAYNATGTKAWLSDAEANFSTVWSRGYDTTFGGGIWWNVAYANTSSGYKASASNWTFVIAGNLLYKTTNNSTYLTEATTIFNWAQSTLYDASTGKVYDGINSSGVQTGQYSYNYGVAAGADYFENRWSDATNVATYLMNNLSSGTVGGYNILPNYGQGGTDGGGFNGIALRWIGYAYVRGALSNSNILSWAQTNVGLAWSQRNSSGLSWNNWSSFTPEGGGLFSWDCSNTVVGMLDIPVISSAADFLLTSSPALLNLTPGNSGSATIAAAPLNGFSGAVDLSVTLIGSPVGIIATLSQSSITGAATSILTVSTASATPGVNYLIGITGTSGSIAHTTYVRLALPYFTLSVIPSNIYLNQGGTATGTITITPQNGFNAEVHFSPPAGLPEGITAWFDPEYASTQTTLELAASSNAVTGVNTLLSITGTSGALTQTVSSTTLMVSAATGDCGRGISVDLSSSYNGTGIYPKGATYSKSGGLDGVGYSYSSDVLATERVLRGIAFKFGPANVPDVVHGDGQTIPLPAGRFTALQLVGTGVGGDQTAQTVVVTYTDGTTSQFTQSFSDWFSPSNNANEAEAVVMPYRNYANGTQDNRPINLYGYTLLLKSDKVVKSVTLPNDKNVVVLAATLTRQYLGDQVNLSSLYNVGGIYTDGATFPANGGIDDDGTAYSANLLDIQAGTSNLVVNGISFSLGAPNVNNAFYGTGQAIALPEGHFSTLRILGTGIQGNQTSQTVTVTYTDGTSTSIAQNFSDWFSPQHYPLESEAEKMAYRNRHDGTKDSQTFNLYQYLLPLDRKKTVKSLMLPANRNVVVLGITLTKAFRPAQGDGTCDAADASEVSTMNSEDR